MLGVAPKQAPLSLVPIPAFPAILQGRQMKLAMETQLPFAQISADS
jgi:hypothetical protein